MDRDAVAVGAVRTAIGKRNGALAQQQAVDLTGQALRELGERTGIDPAVVDHGSTRSAGRSPSGTRSVPPARSS
jgi:acetyl-CoA acetyltransferase